MAFELTITAPLRFFFSASSKLLAVFWGRHEAGFTLELDHGRNASGKLVETWRNPLCGSINVAAFGVCLVWNNGRTMKKVATA